MLLNTRRGAETAFNKESPLPCNVLRATKIPQTLTTNDVDYTYYYIYLYSRYTYVVCTCLYKSIRMRVHAVLKNSGEITIQWGTYYYCPVSLGRASWRPVSRSFSSAPTNAIRRSVDHLDFSRTHARNSIRILGIGMYLCVWTRPSTIRRRLRRKDRNGQAASSEILSYNERRQFIGSARRGVCLSIYTAKMASKRANVAGFPKELRALYAPNAKLGIFSRTLALTSLGKNVMILTVLKVVLAYKTFSRGQ